MKNSNKTESMWLILIFGASLIFFAGCSKFLSASGAPAAGHGSAAAPKPGEVLEEDKDPKTLSAEAYELIGKRQFEAAIAKLKRALQLDPKFAEGYKNVALAHCDSGHPELGVRAAEEALALDPNFDKAQFVMGKILLKLGRTDEAIKRFQAATQLNPKYDKAYYWLGLAYDRANNVSSALQAFSEARRINPDEVVYLGRAESLRGYSSAQSSGKVPNLKKFTGRSHEFSLGVYSQVFYEALIHKNYDFLERAAGEARSSGERWRGGVWKLLFIYKGMQTPLDPNMAAEAEWQNHLALLQEWVDQKPDSITARVALAETYFRYGWQARGTGVAASVTPDNGKLFAERVAKAREILLAVPAARVNCPQWYQLMQAVAMAQGWDLGSYEDLYQRAIAFEPRWESYYGAKAIYLLPRWHGSEEQLHEFLEGLRATPDRDGAMHYFLACQDVAQYAGHEFLFDRNVSVVDLKKGFEQLDKKFGATVFQLNWAAFTAMRLGDKAFTKELLARIKDDWDASVWLNDEGFSAAKKWAES